MKGKRAAAGDAPTGQPVAAAFGEGMTSLKESPQRWWLMVLLTAGMIFCYSQRGALSVAAPFMIRDGRFSPSAMGVLLSAFFWSYSLMQLPAGWLVDRLGVRRGYGIGFAIWSVATAVTGFAGESASLIAARMGLGIGQATSFPASARAVSNWFKDKERGTVTGSYLTGVRLGQALVSAAGAVLLVRCGFKLFFIVIGVLPMIWLLPWTLFLRKWERAEAAFRTGEMRPSAAAPVTFFQSLSLLRQRSVIGIFLGFFAYDYAWYVYVNWLPSYLMMERKFSAYEMGLYSSIPYLAMSGVVLLSGIFSDALVRHGLAEVAVRKCLVVIGLLVCCLIVPAGLVEDKMVAVLLLTLALCGLGIATPNTWTLTQAVSTRNIVGTVSGIQNFGGNLGGIVAPVLTGFIAQATRSFALALSVTGGILVLGALSYILLVYRTIKPGCPFTSGASK